MKLIYIIPIILLLLLGTLFGLHQYDLSLHGEEIAAYQCERTTKVPFPKEYSNIHNNSKDRSLNKLKNNHRLYWNDKGLFGLPDSIFLDYQCLENVDLSYNDLEQIPKTLKFLPNLHSLYLNNNKITETDISNLNADSRYSVLDLSFNPITTLDLGYSLLPYSELRINNCQISNLGQVNSLDLKRIELNKNQLKQFPFELTQLLNLEYLNLANNNINSFELPDHISKSDIVESSIMEIDLSKNQMTNFPKNIGKLKKLKKIDLSENNISGKIDLYLDFVKLEEFNLTNQSVETVMINRSFWNTNKIDLSENKIKDFQFKGKNNSIVILDLSDNQLEEFPDLGNLENLDYLDLRGNEINTLGLMESLYEEGRNSEIKVVNLSRNRLKKIDTISCIIQELDLSYNELTEMPRALNVVELNLSGNNIKETNFSDISISYSLYKLNLSNNEITQWDRNFLKTRVEDLDLSENPISEIPIEDLKEMRNLKRLNIQYTNIPEEVAQDMKDQLRLLDIEVIY